MILLLAMRCFIIDIMPFTGDATAIIAIILHISGMSLYMPLAR